MFAAVDLGSNSFRLHVGEPAGGEIRILRSARDPVRLAAGLDASGRLGEAAIGIGVRSLQGFAAILAEYRLDAVRVVGTNTLRVASNAAEVLKRFEAAIGRPIEIISGEEEGRLIYMGVARALNKHEARLVIDIGGGSTEVIAGHGDSIAQVESFSIGTQPQAGRFFGDGRIGRSAFHTAVPPPAPCSRTRRRTTATTAAGRPMARPARCARSPTPSPGAASATACSRCPACTRCANACSASATWTRWRCPA